MNDIVKAIILFSRIKRIMHKRIDTQKIKNFLLIWCDAGYCLLNIEYTNPIHLDSDMLAGLLRAIQQVMDDGIKRITWEHQTILFEFVDNLLHVLITSSISDEKIYRNSLTKIGDRVRKRFREHPEWLRCIKTGQIRSIRECALDVVQSLRLRELELYLTPRLLTHRDEIPFAIGEFDEVTEHLIGFIDGKRTVGQILDESNIDEELCLGLLSVLYNYSWIELVRIVNLDDMLLLAVLPTKKELDNLGPKDLRLKLVHEFKTPATCREVADEHKIDHYVVLFLAGKLIELGVLNYTN